MKKILNSLLAVVLPLAGIAQQGTAPARPKLVVGLVVDQMRWDYLYRYYDRYEKDGFRRLLQQGFSCEQTFINYLPSFTAPGHSSIYTGSVPAIHGIAANDWTDNTTHKKWYCTQDDSVKTIGAYGTAGQMSPRNLLSSTITDELRLATNFRSRVYGIAIKDRGAILPAGHLANGAYWLDDSTGNFISSSFYGAALPGWLQRFNERHWADTLLSRNWTTLYPIGTYAAQSIADDNHYEYLRKGETSPVFPHMTQGQPVKNIRSTPAGNTLTFKMAKACINGEALGQRDATDFLCLSISSTDYIGHAYAPNAVETEDTYLRLDRDIAALLEYLDEHIGKDNYLFFLSADHGAAHNASFLKDQRLPAGNFPQSLLGRELNTFLKNVFKKDSLVLSASNYQIALNEEKVRSTATDRQRLRDSIIAFCYRYPAIAAVADLEHPESIALPEAIKTRLINGYNKNRSGSIALVYQPGWYSDGPLGTTHGSWNPYDTHIPLLWYGWHIPAGKSNQQVAMTDIAATLAALLHLQMPNGCIGKVITELTDR